MIKNARGFTFIELLIAISIVGILAAVAIPAYLDSVREGHRRIAQGDLVAAVQTVEKHLSTTLSLPAVGAEPFNLWSPSSGTQADRVYTLSYAVNATTGVYTITATPKTGGPVDGDGNITLNSQGVKSWD